MTKFSFVSILLLTGVGAAAVACSSSDDSSSSTGGTGGTGGTHAGGTVGTAGKGGSSGSTTGGTAGSISTEAGAGGEGGGIATDLYTRLGGHLGIAGALHLIVDEELKDPIIGTYFSQQASPTHKPTRADIEECFTNLLGKAAMGPELYPFTTTSGYVCRNMVAAHATLGIGTGTFEKFVMIAGGVLAANGVSDDDVATIAGVLNGQETAIVDPNAASGAHVCQSPASCAVPVIGEGGAPGDGGAGGGL